MANIGSEIGGKIGNQQNPAYTSQGGVTPQEAALAKYDYGQGLIPDIANYASEGPGGGATDSTMVTADTGGTAMGEALNLAQASDINQTAGYNAYNVGNTIQATNQGQALSNLTQLGKLAQAAGGGGGASSLLSGFQSTVGS